MAYKPKTYLTSSVFSVENIGSNEKVSKKVRDSIASLWQRLNEISDVKVFDGRFPTKEQILENIITFKPNIVGCHLSHKITTEMLNEPEIFAIATSTAGYNHIERTEKDDIMITHTPGVLQETVADYTIALIMANLRDLIDLHQYVWNGEWTVKSIWDLDQALSSVITNKVLGIVGLGEIGKEMVRKLYPWGVKIIYFDIMQMKEFEKEFPLLEYKANIEDIFKEADIISLHIPLNKDTEKIIDKQLLKLMKKNALLVNTARGSVIDFNALLDLLEKKEIHINLAFDVFPIEPLDAKTLKRLKAIKKSQPEMRMILLPHNASADADTRGKMVQLFLEDIIKIVESSNFKDLKNLNLIPEHRNQLLEKEWRILNYWKKKREDNYD
ncbi:MAG: 2-hydroxyacid dehydrogenase [Candidatus Hodarchaeota archaeon]